MELIHQRYKNVPGSKQFYFYLSSSSLEKDIDWIKKNKVTKIKLQSNVYKIKNIEPVLKLKGIKSLEIFIENADLSRLNELNELEDLCIGEKV